MDTSQRAGFAAFTAGAIGLASHFLFGVAGITLALISIISVVGAYVAVDPIGFMQSARHAWRETSRVTFENPTLLEDGLSALGSLGSWAVHFLAATIVLGSILTQMTLVSLGMDFLGLNPVLAIIGIMVLYAGGIILFYHEYLAPRIHCAEDSYGVASSLQMMLHLNPLVALYWEALFVRFLARKMFPFLLEVAGETYRFSVSNERLAAAIGASIGIGSGLAVGWAFGVASGISPASMVIVILFSGFGGFCGMALAKQRAQAQVSEDK